MRGALLSLFFSVFTDVSSGQGIATPPPPPLPQPHALPLPDGLPPPHQADQLNSFLAGSAPVPAATKAEALPAAIPGLGPQEPLPAVPAPGAPAADAALPAMPEAPGNNYQKISNLLNEKDAFQSSFSPSELDKVSDLLSLPPTQAETGSQGNDPNILDLPSSLSQPPSSNLQQDGLKEQNLADENEHLYSQVRRAEAIPTRPQVPVKI